MKKGILMLILLAICGIIFWKWFSNQPCLPPDRPTLPKEAVWKGGCDGGNWIELVLIEKEKVRFRIYRDWNGELILDADFKYKDCGIFKLTNINWTEHIAYFDETLVIYESSDLGKCHLEPIYPAYQDEKLE